MINNISRGEPLQGKEEKEKEIDTVTKPCFIVKQIFLEALGIGVNSICFNVFFFTLQQFMVFLTVLL